MKPLIMTLALITAACAQVAVAPLFPISGAIPDFGLVSLMAIAFFMGPGPTTLALPFFAVCLGFLSGREPGLLLLGYMPLLPLALWCENVPVPLTGGGRFLATGVATGFGLRLALSLGAVMRGTPLEPVAVIFSVLIPGAILDIGLLTFTYVACRSLRLEPRKMTLQRRARFA